MKNKVWCCLLAVGLCCIESAASAKIVIDPPPDIPTNLTVPNIKEMMARRNDLLSQFKDTQSTIDNQARDCQEVDEDSPKVDECKARANEVKSAVRDYRTALEQFRSRLDAVLSGNKTEMCNDAPHKIESLRDAIRSNQDAIRKLGLGTSAEAFEQLQGATEEQLEKYKNDMYDAMRDALFSGVFEAGKHTPINSIGTAQAKHLHKLAEDLGITNPYVLEGITSLGNVKNKREKMAKIMDALRDDRETTNAATKVYNSNNDPIVQSSNELAFAMVFVTQAAPDYAKDLAKRFPSFAVGAANKITIESGLAAAPAIASTIDNLIMLHHPRESIDILEKATGEQLTAVSRLRNRMVTLVGELNKQKAVQLSCQH